MTERRTLWVLVLVVVIQLLLLSAQVPGSGERSVLTGGVLGAVAPFAAVVDGVADWVAGRAVALTTRQRLLAENERLRELTEALRREAVRQQGLAADLERLRGAVEYERSGAVEVRLADVIYLDRGSWMKGLWLKVPETTAVPNQPVVTADGLVGRVVSTSGSYARVQLITDRSAAVGAMVERTRRQGVVRGEGGGLVLDFIPLQADLAVGDRLVTAGIDGVYPRGLTIGTVTAVEPGSELFFEVTVTPAADFGAIDHAYLLDVQVLDESLRDLGAPSETPTP